MTIKSILLVFISPFVLFVTLFVLTRSLWSLLLFIPVIIYIAVKGGNRHA